MKTNFIFFFFILILVNGVIATGFSPSNLVYELKQNEEECKTVTVTSDSEISVSDKWAENKDIEWKVSLFEEESSYHGISMNYEEEVDDKVEVCLQGSNVGEYHGVLLLREEQKGNSVVQMGVWLKAVIEEVEKLTETNSGGGGGSSGGSSYTEQPLVNVDEKKEEVKEPENLLEKASPKIEEEEQEENLITGSTVKENKLDYKWFAIPVILIILLTIIFIIKRK